MSENDPDKKRSSHIKNLVADRKHEEHMRAKIVSDEIVKLTTQASRADSDKRRQTDLLFPATTNQLTHNKE